MKTFLLVGFPNSGKSTIFNLLSGKNRKVGNYSGITVDTASAELKSNLENNDKIRIVDLPGIYNLQPSSLDEAVTVSTILNLNKNVESFHEIILVIDASKLEAGLALALSIRDIVGNNISLLINKSDLLYKQRKINWEKLKNLTGFRLLNCSASQNEKNTSLIIDKFLRENISDSPIKVISDILITKKSFELLTLDKNESNIGIKIVNTEQEILEKIEEYNNKARNIIKDVSEQVNSESVRSTYKIDKLLLHPIWGVVIFFIIFYTLFQSLYTLSAPFMDLIESSISSLGDLIGSFLPEGLIKSFVVDGIFAGVGGVLVFLPQIAILFFLLSLMEQSGYIARASFITDRFMSYFGLNGKAFLPYLSGFACSVPAIMAARTIENKAERMATIMTIPLITCSARLPVYVLLIGTFIPSYEIWGLFDSQATALFFLYFFGSIMALIIAKIFRLSFFKSKSKSFFIEMPLYQRPQIKPALKQMLQQSKHFLKKAGTTIFYLSIAIWLLSTFPQVDESIFTNKTEEDIASIKLEKSFIGQAGKVIEPIIKPLGYDWKIGIGVITAFGARELFVSGLGTIYALGDVDEESKTLRERLREVKNPETGEPIYTNAVVWSLLVFFALACQCMSTLAIVKKETNGWKWPIIMFTYMTLIAYIGAFITNKILS